MTFSKSSSDTPGNSSAVSKAPSIASTDEAPESSAYAGKQTYNGIAKTRATHAPRTTFPIEVTGLTNITQK